jgi:hypothetical protein
MSLLKTHKHGVWTEKELNHRWSGGANKREGKVDIIVMKNVLKQEHHLW